MTQTKTCIKCGITDRLEKFVGFGHTAQKRNVCRLCQNIDRDERRWKKAIAKPATAPAIKGDGPCWCCRNQAVGETAYRLCAVCAG